AERARALHAGTRAAGGRAGARHHHRPALAGRQRVGGLAAHRPLAGAAHPVRVRGGLRHARRAGARRQRLRLRAHLARGPGLRPGRAARPPAGRGRAGRHHRRRARDHGGGQQGRRRGRRGVGGAGHRAALRVRAEPARQPGHQLPLLLRPQDDVRQVRAGLRRDARRVRHPRRAVRGAHAGADAEGDLVPGRAVRHRLLAGTARLVPRHRAAARLGRPARPRSAAAHRRPRRGRRPGQGRPRRRL
ncbi:MAG: LOG family protein, partial [uncultured Friedmanniella sp.]